MSARSARASRSARHHEAERKRVFAVAWAKADRAELIHLRVEGDAILGSIVDSLIETNRSENAAAGGRMKAIYNILKRCELATPVTTSDGMPTWSQVDTARRVATSEVALALRIPERTATMMIEDARYLVEMLPTTMQKLLVGEFSLRHARGIVDHARRLPDEKVAEFEAKILPFATKLTFTKFNLKARILREKIDAATIEERHQKSLTDRETYVDPDENGMAWVHLYQSASVAMGAFNRADQMARKLAEVPDETRTLAQIRADVMADLLLDGTIEGRPETSIRPSVTVTVPLRSMLGLKSPNGEIELPVLEGYGPIDIPTARRLAGAAKSWLQVFTTPNSDAIVSVGQQRRVPAQLKALLTLIDGTCRKPGCTRPVYQCDLDHAEEFQHGGQTAHDNLEHLCKQHHAEKHHTGVKVEHQPDGNIRWTMPSGRSYDSEPDMRAVWMADPIDAPPDEDDWDVA